MFKTLIAICAVLVICAITIWVVRRCCARCDQRQFPTSYTLLKSSPQILVREMWALKLIAVLSLVFLLLLLTSAI